jgi:nicotinamidase-related amidase/alkylated DNA repair dioxygenase AlkB/glutathione S-transferase
MSFFSFGDIPAIQTRKALLLLDFQNDFVRPAGALHVPNTADILEILPPLAAAFRRSGDVIWVRSQYESPQPTEDWNFGDRVVLENGPPKPAPPLPTSDVIEVSSDRDSPEPVDTEAFLSGRSAKCCAPQSPGFQFPAPVLAAIDPDRDTVLDKTGYSALESEGLVLSFRTRFVTDLYLCGSLSNVSVYATALDAVRNGFSVTVVEDCLGYRDFQRHQEAMRRMADILGAAGITAQELNQELEWQETDEIARQNKTQPPKRSTTAGAPVGIEDIMDSLDVMPVDSIPEEAPDEGSYSLAQLASQTRATRVAAAAARIPVEGKKQVRARVRRPKRREPTPGGGAGDGSTKGLSDDSLGEGDSRIIPEIDLPADAFERMRAEVSWQKMYHLSGQVPRLVAVQGHIQPDGSIPIYRHPADESPPLKPFTPAVDEARILVERILGHPLNHVLIQLYRDGQDSISEHSDKTLDIVRGSFICNVSLGAQRVMTLRTKASASESHEGAESSRLKQQVPLPHRSLFILGEKTNMRWLHGIRPDKRAASIKSSAEQAFGGERISLTFRHIGTYLNPNTNTIWGQGAISKSPDTARTVIHGEPAETERLIRAFGQENRATEFDWDAFYGAGFDVVNFVTTTPARLTLGGNLVADLRVQMGLGENGLRYEIVDDKPHGQDGTPSPQPLYTDPDGRTIAGDVAILTHLAERPAESIRPGVEALQGGNELQWIDGFLNRWREHRAINPDCTFETNLEDCDRALEGRHYLGGSSLSIDDCSFWPVLREIVLSQGPFDARWVNLNQYYARVEKRGIVRAILEGSQ